MIKKLTLGTLVLLAFVYSCKKDEETENPAKEIVPLITTRAISYEKHPEIDSTSFIYDDEGRCTRFGDRNEHTDVTYSGSNVVFTSYDGNVLDYTDTYTLNDQGLALTQIRTKPGSSNSSEKYIYNTKNQLTKTVVIENGIQDTTFYFYDGDNVATMVTRYEENSIVTSDTTRFEYYTDKISTVEMTNLGFPFIGPRNKNLIKKTMRRYGTTEFTYEFDSKDRVIKETATSNGSVDHYVHYTYKD